jgi:uncharacterized membrane protein
MTSRTRAVVLVFVVVLCLVLTGQIARGLGIERAVGLLSLANLATLVIGIKLGWRQALLGVGSLAVLTIPTMLSQGNPAAGTVVMTLTAFALGLSARWQLQPVYWLMVVSLCLLITNSPLAATASTSDLARLVLGVLAGVCNGISLAALYTAAAAGPISIVAPIAATRMTEDIMPAEILEKLTPEYVAPVVAYLCTEEVPDTASVFIVGGGKVQRTALFQNEGVTFDEVPTVDDVAAHWSQIDDLSSAKQAAFKL